MGNLDTALKRYYRSISKELPCSRKMKEQILLQIQENVSIFLEQNPAATFEMVQAHFGTAQEIASSYIDDQDAPELLRRIHIKKKILVIVAGVLMFALLIWGAAVVWTTIEANNTYNGHVVVDIEEN